MRTMRAKSTQPTWSLKAEEQATPSHPLPPPLPFSTAPLSKMVNPIVFNDLVDFKDSADSILSAIVGDDFGPRINT